MSEKTEPSAENGGPAFPGAVDTAAPPGMTLRDWLAGQALHGMLAAGDEDCENYAAAASYSYSYADAMLAERRK